MRSIAAYALWLGILAGCQKVSDSEPQPGMTADQVRQVIELATQSAAKKAAEDAVPMEAAADTNAVEPIAPPTDHVFEPPFGERVHLFAPPEQDTNAPRVDAQSGRGTRDVALKGFVKLGDQRAVLIINDELATLSVGEEKAGIRVLAIDPPQVDLQDGRKRWSVSLFPDASREDGND